MKKLSTRTVLFILLITASICSYIYLNTVSVSSYNTPEAQEAISEDPDEVDAEQSELILPDVQLLKKVIETGKRFIPAS